MDWRIERRLSSDSCINNWLLFEANNYEKKYDVRLTQEGEQQLVIRIKNLHSALYKNVVEEYDAIMSRERFSLIARERKPCAKLMATDYYKLPLEAKKAYYVFLLIFHNANNLNFHYKIIYN